MTAITQSYSGEGHPFARTYTAAQKSTGIFSSNYAGIVLCNSRHNKNAVFGQPLQQELEHHGCNCRFDRG